MMKLYIKIAKKRLLLIAAALMFGVTAVIGSTAWPQAGAGQQGNEPQNIALDFLDIEKPFGAGKAHRDYINGLIARAKVKIPVRTAYQREEAVATLKSIDALLREEGFVFKNNLLLSKGIDTKLFDCDNYCALYTAIAEELKIPIIPVYAPSHSFIRFYLDDGTYLNWETTKGATETDDYYIKALRIAESSIQKGVYLKMLTRKEFIGVEYNNIGAYLMSEKKFLDAVPYFTMAITYYPKFSSAYHNRGTAFYATRRLKKALDDLLTANGLDPNRASTRNTLGDVYFDLKEYDRAVEEYRTAIELAPGNHVTYYSMGLIMKAMGKEEEASQWFKKSEEIKGRNKK